MRRLVIAGALAVSLSATAVQAAPANADPTDDLNCAIWAANVSGTTKDPEISNGFGLIMTWFIGRWEGATGRKFEDGMTADYIVKISPNFDKIGQGCLVRMQDFATRMSAWGDKLGKSGR